MSIVSFKDEPTRDIALGKASRKARARLPIELHRTAMLKIAALDLATALSDLGPSTGLRLEKLSGDRAGQWSIRINRQYRICFRWIDGDAEDVEILDYH